MRAHKKGLKANRHYNSVNVKSTLEASINPTRSHAADFRRIGPQAMDKLVRAGLFVRLPHDELGRPQYKITAKGLAVLAEEELLNALR
jgi:hypothetical protein